MRGGGFIIGNGMWSITLTDGEVTLPQAWAFRMFFGSATCFPAETH